MKAETVIEVLEKLIGSISPAGASHLDDKRFENLKVMCEVAEKLIGEIDKVAYENKDRHEYSMKIMGEYAAEFLTKNIGIVK